MGSKKSRVVICNASSNVVNDYDREKNSQSGAQIICSKAAK